MQNDINNQNILPVGTTLKNGQYRIVRHLKSGGFGNTYVVEDTSFHERSAMKEFFIHAKGVNTRSGMTVTVSNPVNEDDFLLYKRKFIHEIQRLRELHNRHVVRIYDDFEENNTAYYVMEFIDGESLTDRLSRTGRAMTEAEVTDVLRQVLNALTEVHGKGFVHADITPNNIMIDKSGNVVLIDFGSTKEVEEGNHRSTLAAMTRTPGYTPQEQLDGDVSRMGPWSDFYALGVTLFRLLTLESSLELKDKEEEAFAPYQDHISQPMRDLILWMTQLHRRKRPQTVEAILDFLDKRGEVEKEAVMPSEKASFTSGKPTTDEQTRYGVFSQGNDETELQQQQYESEEKPTSSSVRSHPWKWLSMIAVIAVIAVGVGAYWLMTHNKTTNSPVAVLSADTAAVDTVKEEVTQEYMKLPEEQRNIIQNLINNMVPVEGGTFTMGATSEQGGDTNDDEKPAHKVTLSSFSIGKYEVTQEEWKAVMGNNPSEFKGAKLPVEQVSWDDCQEFIRKLNALTGKQFRLPTEAEWEYAARGGNRSRGYKYSGSDNLGSVAWRYDYDNGGNTTHPVGQKQANELGLYDMSGNVWEWCQDWYGDYSSSSQTNPKGPSLGSDRVFRGGSWGVVWNLSYRNSRTPDYLDIYIGFRLAL